MIDTVAQRLASDRLHQPLVDASARAAFVESSTSVLGPAYCISLATKLDRRAFCQHQFDTENVSVAFFDAIVPTDRNRFPTLGAYGCFQSHLTILEKALADRQQTCTEHVTIFEDDVLLPRGFMEIVRQSMKQLESLDWHVMYWGTQNDPPMTPLPGREPLATIAPRQTIIGKQAYTVRLDRAQTLIDYLHLGARQPNPAYSDGMFHEFRMKNNLVAHTHTLAPARQGSFASNITPAGSGWLRKPLRAIKRRVQLWRR